MTYCKRKDCIHYDVCAYKACKFVCPYYVCNTYNRPQGKYVDISKLRLMTVEECAGHTIDYAMGWKACVEWIKKGSAE